MQRLAEEFVFRTVGHCSCQLSVFCFTGLRCERWPHNDKTWPRREDVLKFPEELDFVVSWTLSRAKWIDLRIQNFVIRPRQASVTIYLVRACLPRQASAPAYLHLPLLLPGVVPCWLPFNPTSSLGHSHRAVQQLNN